MRKPISLMLPPIECMPFAHYCPVVWEELAETASADEAVVELVAGKAEPQLGFWGRVLESFAALSWPHGYTGI